MSTEDFRGQRPGGVSGSEGRFLSLHARYGSEVISVMGPENNLLYESDSIERMLGYRHAEEVSAAGDWFRYVHPEDMERLGRAVEGCMSTPGESPPVEFRIKDSEGNWRWLESRGVNLFDDPQVGGVVVSTYEVTGRKRAEEAQKESEERLVSAFEDAPMGVSVIDLDGGILAANPALCEMLGYSRYELTGKSSFELIHRDYMEQSRTCEQRLLSGEVRQTGMEKRLVRKDGGAVWVYCNVLLGRDSRGEPEHFVCHIQDIAERKRSERCLKESEERFRGAFTEAPIDVALVGIDSRLLKVNHAFREMFGYPEAELLSLTSYDLLHPSDHAASEEWMSRQGSKGARDDPMELRFLTKGGDVIWVLVSAALVKDVAGEPGHWVCHYQDITGRKALEKSLAHRALHDPLTGLPGRELLTDRLRNARERAERDGGSVAMLFVDTDNLKLVNDSLGHESGDRLLRTVGERLRERVRDEDTVARFGGDEFVVLLEGSATEEYARLIADRILQGLEQPVYLDEREIPVTVSVGIAVGFSPEQSAEDLIRHADAAMYRAKAVGGNGYSVFDPEMDRDDLERLELSSDLHRAIERGELHVHYQHKVDLSTGGIAGWEALLRWEHPGRGTISPEKFIPLAEETGLIVPIGRWVLGKACEQAQVWREGHPREPGQFMSVNLSPRQLADPGLEDEIGQALERSGLPAGALDLEITERVLLEDEHSEFARLRELKKLGLTFSLDDFGTGYSSLSSLKRLPVDCIKIDRSFVAGLPADPEDEAFVTAMLGLARALGLKVVAEGIENASQWDRLRELGCDYGQGYHFAPPLPAEEASYHLVSGFGSE